ncbi:MULTISPECIES: siderophore-interacting protein [unclassified Duganella]|uniref:siderophore-interacting protein n=1 Tax=unclassified Duganella TaxID=2636909 RepID=UPI00088502F5|nr:MULTISPECIES: siderophore-interacting protein [unclassified Duganella]SDH63939.1 NADPH-dependent ferric siderophore reductase, contains FAD-binding and SIP domains [Duganella sp. OV458]SDJ42568.1 NADPH-dependent ferric siderophore reductase, contains FAD-binding and SIP domains [Duganella sp. OV510]
MDTTTSPQRAGRIELALQKIFTRSAQVLEVEDVGGSFRLVTLGGDALRDAAWTPGDKIQVMLGGWVQRTYTPIDWDGELGRMRFLVYLHGDAPGTQWARSLRAGDSCAFFGPRKSIRLAPAASPVILFGDETSLGLGAALSAQATTYMLFEAGEHVRAAVDRLGLPNAGIESDPRALAAQMAALLQAHPDADIVLTGKAGAIQQMTRLLHQHGTAAKRRQSKAYWAPGKTGLD